MAESTGASADIRRVLLTSTGPMSVSEIFAACDVVKNATEVASMMHIEYGAGRVTRSGEKGSYRYSLTDKGRAIAQDPRLLHSRSNRRTRGRSNPQMPAPIIQALAPSTAADSARPTTPRTLPSELDAPMDDRTARLAASVLANWPAPIHTMPADLLHIVQASLAGVMPVA